jgi:glycosyltransferase involved in cell wall biosynthesis
MAKEDPLLSVVVPVYNEAGSLETLHENLVNQLQESASGSYEIIYCDDGSSDESVEVIRKLSASNSQVKLIKLSRNFGKENALSAGIATARGQAIISLDGDGQHPVELIPDFVAAWKDGGQVVIGVRQNNSGDDWLKRAGSHAFYKIFNKITGQELVPGSTDFRLIDKTVQQAFLELKETDRITRGLIDWLGFKREFIPFKAKPRKQGFPGYSSKKLFGLALNSFVSSSPAPLYAFGYLGIFITGISLLLGLAVFIEQLLLSDPWHWRFTGTAMLSILILFLIGLVLLSQGILSLYISYIHNQSKGRPIYIIDYAGSVGIKQPNENQ